MDNQQELYKSGIKVDTLYRAVRDSQTVELIPQLVKQVISQEMWRAHYYEKTGETFRFDSLRQFIECHPPDGLGTSVEALFKLCLEDSEAIEMLDVALQSDAEGSKDSNNPTKKPIISSARQSGLRKLRALAEQNSEIAALRESVIKGELSVNAALITAGLRKKRISMVKDIEKIPAALKRNFTPDERQQIIALMQEDQT